MILISKSRIFQKKVFYFNICIKIEYILIEDELNQISKDSNKPSSIEDFNTGELDDKFLEEKEIEGDIKNENIKSLTINEEEEEDNPMVQKDEDLESEEEEEEKYSKNKLKIDEKIVIKK